MIEKIKKLKKDKNVIILAHYYQRGDVQDIADYVGDSFYLAQVGKESDADVIVFCGVRFMAESAKILSPEKTVLFPCYTEAPCCMEYMATPEEILQYKDKHPDVKVVTYVNSSSAVKTVSDVCCTSSSVENIINNLDAENILFVPDKNLASYVQEQVPHKKIIPWDGCCNIHDAVKISDLEKALIENGRDLIITAHPECRKDVRNMAHYVGSTSGILSYIKKSSNKRFLVVTEKGIYHQLRKDNPEKEFFFLPMLCMAMKKIFPETILESLETMTGEIVLDDKTVNEAAKALNNMLLFSRPRGE
ncbi:quinolinate synthase NadA [uncultured Ilyobacter sp.]|uniref:quinolinate synthase NadA n=1 Tax=uncultured Ilyobacter sp. TaxID=544433 RepID=UPI0029C94709|nr:quinolinate synthase NadA [uncultured Ilyobacter sp.]